MNSSQKLLTLAALLAFAASFIWAPWEYKLGDTQLEDFAPIWSTSDIPSLYKDRHLRMQLLTIEWGALAVIYAGLFFVMGNKHKNTA